MRIKTLVLALSLSSATALAQETSITYYETLSPHGDWVVVESYGRVWRPHRHVVGVDFVPYSTGGRWVHSNHGWVFEPSYSWGWLPFHYGRWYQDPFNGWVWVPGDVWAPAWVEWRIGGGYIGWAPSPPRYHSHTRHHWYFVENRHFVEPNIWQHRAVAVNHDTVWHATRPVPPSGRGWAPGPSVTDVRAAAPVPIPERRIDPPRPMPIFPKDMPPAAPPPPVPSQQAPGGPRGPGFDRGSPPPIQHVPGPQRDNRPDPIQQAPQPQRQPPMQMQQPMPQPQRQPPGQMQPMPQRMPEPQRQAPSQMQPMPQRQQPMPQQQRQPMPQPMPQQQRQAPSQMQPMPQRQQQMPPQQRQPMPQAMPQPMPQQQAPQQAAPQRRPQGQPGQPGQPFPGAGPQRGPPPGAPAGPPR